jgi:hypothetical protein
VPIIHQHSCNIDYFNPNQAHCYFSSVCCLKSSKTIGIWISYEYSQQTCRKISRRILGFLLNIVAGLPLRYITKHMLLISQFGYKKDIMLRLFVSKPTSHGLAVILHLSATLHQTHAMHGTLQQTLLPQVRSSNQVSR